jgi:hypothetical protein
VEALLARRLRGQAIDATERGLIAVRTQLELDGGQLEADEGAEAIDRLVEPPQRLGVLAGGELRVQAGEVVVGRGRRHTRDGALPVGGARRGVAQGQRRPRALGEARGALGVAGHEAIEIHLRLPRALPVDEGAATQEIGRVVARREAGGALEVRQRAIDVAVLAMKLAAPDVRLGVVWLAAHALVGRGDELVKRSVRLGRPRQQKEQGRCPRGVHREPS